MSEKIKFNEQKSTEAASLLLHLKGGRADYWWIIKMLYLVDREAFKTWERPITNDFYKSLPYGPVGMSVYCLNRSSRTVKPVHAAQWEEKKALVDVL